MSESEVPAPSRSILIVDDDRDFAEGLAGVLARLGHDAESVFAAADAGRAMAGRKFHLVFVDLKLATDNGLELIQELRARWPESLFILVTAYSSLDSAVHALQVGAYDYLRKPFSIDALKIALQRAIGHIDADESRRAALRSLDAANSELRQINERLEYLVSSARSLTGAEEPASLYPKLLETFADSMGATGGSLYLVRPTELELVCALDPGHAPARIPLPLPSQGVFAMLLERREPVLIEDIGSFRGLTSSGWKGYCDTSVLAFPISAQDGSTAAVISLHSKDAPPFTRVDLHLGVILRGHVQEALRAAMAFEALASSERKYRDLAEGSVQAIVILDGEQVLFANAAARAVFGRSPGEEPGPILRRDLPAELVAPPEEPPPGADPPAGSAPVTRLVKVPQASGASRWIEAVATRIRWEGRPAVQIAGIDVTARILAEERLLTQQRSLIQADKMAALGTLVSGVAHEVNNPVNLIGLNASLLKRIWADLRDGVAGLVSGRAAERIGGLPAGRIPETIGRLIDGVDDGALRIQHIVGRLKDFSQKQDRDHFGPVEVNSVVQSAVELTQAELRRATEAFTQELAAGLPAVQGNRIELAQVIVNLITNACHALTARDQPITVSTFALPEAGEVVVEVRDGGCGIPQEHLSTIFDPFYTTKQARGGTGLGLYVGYGIVRDHRGRIEVTSQPQRGTSIRIVLPAAPEAAQADAKDGAGPGPHDGAQADVQDSTEDGAQPGAQTD